MIDDLDKTVDALLRRSLPPGIVNQVSISFATPDGNFPPASVTLPAIDLFLYDIREDVERRDTEWLVERTPTGEINRTPPEVRIECSYLVTAWAKDAVTQAQDEHYLLGETMKAMLRYSRIPAEVLQGALANKLPLLPTSTLQAGRLQSPGEFWQALGGKPKAAFHYSVTFGAEIRGTAELGPQVTDKLLKFAQSGNGG